MGAELAHFACLVCRRMQAGGYAVGPMAGFHRFRFLAHHMCWFWDLPMQNHGGEVPAMQMYPCPSAKCGISTGPLPNQTQKHCRGGGHIRALAAASSGWSVRRRSGPSANVWPPEADQRRICSDDPSMEIHLVFVCLRSDVATQSKGPGSIDALGRSAAWGFEADDRSGSHFGRYRRKRLCSSRHA